MFYDRDIFHIICHHRIRPENSSYAGAVSSRPYEHLKQIPNPAILKLFWLLFLIRPSKRIQRAIYRLNPALLLSILR